MRCNVCNLDLATEIAPLYTDGKGPVFMERQCLAAGCGLIVRICRACRDNGRADRELVDAMTAGRTHGMVQPVLIFHDCKATGRWSEPYQREYRLGTSPPRARDRGLKKAEPE